MSTSILSHHFIVIHEIPGRCRIRVPNLGMNRYIYADLENRLNSCYPIDKFHINKVCSSIIIQYQGAIEVLFNLLDQTTEINQNLIEIKPK